MKVSTTNVIIIILLTIFAVYHVLDKINYRSEEREKQRQHEKYMMDREAEEKERQRKHTSEQNELNRKLEREKLEAAKLNSKPQ